ncbi:MAG TPA: aminotransferase [Lachnospiraceae bacterium]|nr:aminotransferase [Lachnospiraceae bacterium]
MKNYRDLTPEEMKQELAQLRHVYDQVKAEKLELNMARGKPAADQLDLSMPMLNDLNTLDDLISEDGTDCRNYGTLDGIIEAKKLIADLMEVKPENVFVGGNASLQLMYIMVANAWCFGIDGCQPWCRQGTVKFLCPVPGYDRHFRITEVFGIQLVNIPMHEDGPDMDLVEQYVNNDPTVKGIWCVPKYSNPDGYSYSDETVRRFAALKPAAKDFRIFWDNAYFFHHLDFDHPDVILNIMDECQKAGSPDLVYEFMSTSKMALPGASISAVITSPHNMDQLKHQISAQIISFDKVNQMRQVKFFKDPQHLAEHMKKHAALLLPKFQTVWDAFKELGDLGIARWTTPRGGYFISLYTLPGCAKRTVQLCKEAGVTLTGAGAAFPYGIDPEDSHIRIAPSYPSLDDLKKACRVVVLSVKIASLEKLIG